ncbi:MAG: hypothetical protein JSS81_28730 [Acidobacteria bacterium]|nr:hypothetical protein [Acidobacteriota bacterium]
MSWQDDALRIINELRPQESPWKFVTSGGGELSVGTPVAHVGINAGGGVLHVKRDSDPAPTVLHYGGLGGSVGLSLIPFVGNFSFSITAMPSAGRIYKLPLAGRTLSLDELRGPFVALEVGADAGPGVGGALMFIGGSMLAANVAGSMTSGSMTLVALMATAKACAAFGGMTATVLPFNASISALVGAIL